MIYRIPCLIFAFVFLCVLELHANEPPALANPLSRRESSDVREDTVPGYVEMSNGEVFPGLLYITRDKRLEMYDVDLKRQRTVPLQKIARIDCNVEKEWMEELWRFKELASDEKLYTGQKYPSRVFTYTLTLDDDRTLEGPMSGLIYVQPLEEGEDAAIGHLPDRDAKRLFFQKRHSEKTDAGKKLEDVHYLKLVKIGDEAFEEGIQKAKAFGNKKNAKTPPAKIMKRAPDKKRAKI